MTRGLRRAAAALAIGLAAGSAGFVQSTSDSSGAPLSWPTSVVPYAVNPAHPFGAPSCGGEATLEAVRASFGAWRQSCSALALVDGGTVAEIRTGRLGSGENLVVFRQGWCRARLPASEPCLSDPELDCGGIHNCFEDSSPADRFTLALTSVLYVPRDGRIVDADIEVNGWDGTGAGATIASGNNPPARGWYFTCNGQTTTPCTTYGQDGCHYIDLQATLTHEVGHFIGLRHVCDGGGSSADAGLPRCDASHQAITMHPNTGIGDVEKRTLHPDDVAGVCAIYPNARSSGGGCSSGGPVGALGMLFAAAGLGLVRRR